MWTSKRPIYKVYDVQTGGVLRVIGRKGSGPGEFLYPTGAAVLQNGMLAVRDPQLQRVTLFDRAGRHYDSWSAPIVSTAGLGATRDGRLVLPGRMVANEAYVSDSILHVYSADGVRLASHLTEPETRHYAESNFNGVRASVVDGWVVSLQPITNLLRLVDLSTGVERVDTVGGWFYRPVEWTLEPPGDEVDQWLREQMLAWWVRGLGSGIYAIGFQEFVPERDSFATRWVFSTLAGPVAESRPTRAQPAFLKADTIYSVLLEPDGQAKLLVGSVSWGAAR